MAMRIDPIAEFRKDHSMVRDLLLELINALDRLDVQRSLEILIELDRLGGPHFRFEEETLYPMMEKFYGREYLEYLLSAHDKVIRAARRIAEVLGKGEITREEADELIGLIRRDVLPHPIECEGLVLLAEKLSREELERVAESIEKARSEGVPLIEWAESIRARKV